MAETLSPFSENSVEELDRLVELLSWGDLSYKKNGQKFNQRYAAAQAIIHMMYSGKISEDGVVLQNYGLRNSGPSSDEYKRMCKALFTLRGYIAYKLKDDEKMRLGLRTCIHKLI